MSNELYDEREFLPLQYKKTIDKIVELTVEIPENVVLGEN